ncbi:uncharacterized protein HKBW3S43_00003 [Candidatus Hakubella thermalkaliphila]|uniref:DUF501 domain-containing protein n=2 Tax=Candidatus Hakubella thermalkaliphila TaxID=2754717 RepID=A0A6V8NXG2_9ACTN|nr:uncharacterized protein HKBW3S25_00335 [Candidatus Hakubella thermalkaliphila]GFP27424.1 uncharacterized protein HKBW3S33_00837 [Candidatus Hakubella thermalkaliphila]GFP34212.1 uncharacterized protein HKBW3S43_00003 [Candidatus Hakubella thermalkaliphila]
MESLPEQTYIKNMTNAKRPMSNAAKSTFVPGELSLLDLRVIQCQLGRPPHQVLGAVTRCRYGLPEVILTNPIIEGKSPFPTFLWLSCPLLKKKIDRLEGAGWVRRLQAIVDGTKDEGGGGKRNELPRRGLGIEESVSTPLSSSQKNEVEILETLKQEIREGASEVSLGTQLIEDNQSYICLRNRYIDSTIREKFGSLEKKGIAGSENLSRIKCLHAHYAHFLATGENIIGRIIHRLLDARKGYTCSTAL